MQIEESWWFAAGPRVSKALTILSDGAFRLYMYLCLQAPRDTGSVSIRYASAAQALNKSKRSINTYFEELRKHGVCVVDSASNQHESNRIEICDEFWPYSRSNKEDEEIEEQRAYLAIIKSKLDKRVCVACSFGPADREFALELYASNCPVEIIERATNLYTIVPLRTANSKTLVEQSIGRGLRLPYGKRTGVADVDRLTIVSHERFQEIVDYANDPGSIIRTGVVIGRDIPDAPTQAVTISPSILTVLGIASQPAGQAAAITVTEPLFKTEPEVNVAKATLDVIHREFEGLRRSSAA